MTPEATNLALVIATWVLVGVTAVYATLTFFVMRATGRLAHKTADMAQSTRALAEGQVSARLALEFGPRTPRTQAGRRYQARVGGLDKLLVINHGPGWATNVRVMSGAGDLIDDLGDLRPQEEVLCPKAAGHASIELHWRDSLSGERGLVQQYSRDNDEEWAAVLPRR